MDKFKLNDPKIRKKASALVKKLDAAGTPHNMSPEEINDLIAEAKA